MLKTAKRTFGLRAPMAEIAKKEFEPDDPLEMVGVELPCQSEKELRDMALCFAEEFIREGWNKDKIFGMFRHPFYQGPHLAWKQKGDEFILSAIDEAMKMWRPEERS